MSAAPPAAVRPRPWLAPLLAGTLALLIAGGVWYAADSLLADLCGSAEISRLTAPDGRHDAVLFEHNCGATTDFATHVAVLPAGAPLGDTAGNAFVAEAGEGGLRAAWGGPPVEIAWDVNGALAIRFDAAAEVFHQSAVVDGVPVHAEALP
ncbi:MAG: hypothetical protein KC432_16610 [Thermomicrobiales bacterium]|nr:hypothetical protein [Thermomicrobiales bacterium]